ncbi:hypothetical protein TH66_00950 [Carbonactinospora thermoautotrophica]|uniref:Sporadically distributed protein, TIGR04141 family n=2 Tax=Carbonactinospora thermoautotrophica TaxID=1469144 RepID=A0A132N6F2_9ACTN|nr:hypothetical protein LI90_2436 [Carbonactinospora thermoautotrophica]KWX05663.1 hypothetical protein TH66_00950 [Carbonactinospora thermoautotrophica]KWX09721.1 hypothetical protein TR74_07900 [Carbonactinospora thermoautotrophica]
MGHLLIDRGFIEPGFGLAFAVRVVDPGKVRQATHRLIDTSGRINRSSVPSGQHIRAFGIEEYGEIIGRLTGELRGVSLTFTRRRDRAASIAGADALKIHLGTSTEDLLTDLREISRICAQGSPVPGLEFITQTRALKAGEEPEGELNQKLAEMLGAPEPPDTLALAIPDACLAQEETAHSYRVRIGSGRYQVIDDLTLADIVGPLRNLPQEERLEALREGYVQMCSDAEGKEEASQRIKARNWITAEIPLGAGRYVYHQGRWYVVGEGHLDALRERVREILERGSSLELPPWPREYKEDQYNRYAADQLGLVCMDKKSLHTKQHPHGIEACDLLGPGNELIHVKRAKEGSTPLSHLFAQGIIAVDALLNEPDAREKFVQQVREQNPDWPIDETFRPRKVVYAIMLKSGEAITVKSLFTFAQVMLYRAVTTLQRLNVEVEVVGIPR